MKEQLEDVFRYLIGGYYGINELDNYSLKQYLLKDIEEYIKNFIEKNPIVNFDYQKEAEIVKDTVSLKTKLQDSLLVLYKVDAPMEVVWMVKQKIKELEKR